MTSERDSARPAATSLWALLFPPRYRYLPGARFINVTLRSLHILGVAVFAGGYFFAQPPAALAPWWWLAAGSGLLMVVVELYGSFQFVVELRGVAVFVKLGLLALLPDAGAGGFWLLAVVILLASVSSHMTGRLRHIRIVPAVSIERLAGRQPPAG